MRLGQVIVFVKCVTYYNREDLCTRIEQGWPELFAQGPNKKKEISTSALIFNLLLNICRVEKK